VTEGGQLDDGVHEFYYTAKPYDVKALEAWDKKPNVIAGNQQPHEAKRRKLNPLCSNRQHAPLFFYRQECGVPELHENLPGGTSQIGIAHSVKHLLLRHRYPFRL